MNGTVWVLFMLARVLRVAALSFALVGCAAVPTAAENDGTVQVLIEVMFRVQFLVEGLMRQNAILKQQLDELRGGKCPGSGI